MFGNHQMNGYPYSYPIQYGQPINPYYPNQMNEFQYFIPPPIQQFYPTQQMVPQPTYFQECTQQPISVIEPQKSDLVEEIKKTNQVQEKTVNCNCTKSSCMKQYCFCFRQGQACGPKCGCNNCKNKKNCVILRPERKRKLDSLKCNCKQSRCQKKYCECFSAGRKCSQVCNCQNCCNQ